MTTDRTANVLERVRRLRFDQEGRKIVVGVLLITAIVFGQDVVGAATSSSRLDPSLAQATGPSNVVVVLDFAPERFHNERLARYGVFSGRDGSVRRVRLRMVSPDNLKRLASLVWVARIEPLAPPGAIAPSPASAGR